MLAGDPLPGRDQGVPGALAGIGQVHRGDPVGCFPGAAQVVPLDPGRALALPVLAGLIDRADRQAAAAAGAGGLVQPADREPAHCPHHRGGVPDGPAEQPLHPVRGPVPGLLGERPAVAPGNLAHQRGGVLARLQPGLHPRETRAQQLQQLSAFPPGQARRLSWRQQPPPVLLSSHTHNRQAAAPCEDPQSAQQQVKPRMATAVLASGRWGPGSRSNRMRRRRRP